MNHLEKYINYQHNEVFGSEIKFMRILSPLNITPYSSCIFLAYWSNIYKVKIELKWIIESAVKPIGVTISLAKHMSKINDNMCIGKR